LSGSGDDPSGVPALPFVYDCYGKCGAYPGWENITTQESSGVPVESSSEESVALASDDGMYKGMKRLV